MKSFNKLVRDNIPAIIKENGEQAITHIASEGEYKEALKQKLEEEVAEFLENSNPEELADILEVIHSIAMAYQIPFDEIEKLRTNKCKSRGSFHKRIILEKTIK